MKQKHRIAIRTIIDVVKDYEKAHEFNLVVESEAAFYNTAFWEAIKLIEEITGEKLCN